MNPLLCERCGRDLESDDAISIIEGICCACRRHDAREQIRTGARLVPPAPPTAAAQPPRFPHRRPVPRPVPPPPTAGRSASTPVRPALITPASSIEGESATRSSRRKRDLAIGVGVGLLLTFAATGYFISKRVPAPALAISSGERTGSLPIRLTVKPAWAEVTLDGQPIQPANDNGQFQLTLPGEPDELKWLNVAAEGYHEVRRPLSALGGVDDISIELVQKPIEVAIRSEPPNAKVWIDEQFKGTTPLDLTLLSWESSRLAVRHDGYEAVEQPIRPPAKGNRLELNFDLKPAGLLVRVETQPPGAIVTVDGRAGGTTPVDLPIPSEQRGSEIQIVAALAGYEPATHLLQLPEVGDGQPIVARLALSRPQCELIVQTDPPGAEVFVAGKSYGASPAQVRFGPEYAGQRIQIEGRIPGTYAGRTSVLVPPGGQSREVLLEMEMTGQRVVFLVLSPTGAGADHALLTDHLIEQIHRLEERQHFAVLACTIEGIAAWPAIGETVPATSDNKIRAYDHVRGIRPSARGAVPEAMQAAMQTHPNTIWLFAGPKLVTDDLLPLGAADSTDAPTVNAVQIAPRYKPKWLESFVQARGGMLTVIEPAPRRLAVQNSASLD